MDNSIQINVFCPPSLELALLFTGTRERSSCHGEVGIKGRDFTKVHHSIKADIAAGLLGFYPFFFLCIIFKSITACTPCICYRSNLISG